MTIIIEDDNGTLTRIVQYLLEKDGHAVMRKGDEHILEVILNLHVANFFD